MRKSVLQRRYKRAPIAALAVVVAVPLGANTMLQAKQKLRDGTVSAGVAAPPPAGAGWQAYFTQDVQQGTDLLFTYSCPASAPTPVGNSFGPNTQARVGLELVGSRSEERRVGKECRSRWSPYH